MRVGNLDIPDHLLAINPHLRPLAVPSGTDGAGSPGRWKGTVGVSVRRDGQRVTVTLKGLRLVSEANAREHWSSRDRRRAWQQDLLDGALRGVQPPPLPVRVTIVRVGPRRLDADNAQGSGKHLRDAVARWCGVDDGDVGRFTCRVEQERGDYAVRVLVIGGESDGA